MDEGVKQVVGALETSGVLDNTLVVYMSDNGYFHGEHRIAKDKQRVYEESIRVPLQMRGPGIPQRETVSEPVINADLAPTIIDAANAQPGLTMDGRSLLPVAKDPAVDRDREVLIEEPTFEAIRTARYMYAEYGGGGKELYDLARTRSSFRAGTTRPPMPRSSRCSRTAFTSSRPVPAPVAAPISATPPVRLPSSVGEAGCQPGVSVLLDRRVGSRSSTDRGRSHPGAIEIGGIEGEARRQGRRSRIYRRVWSPVRRVRPWLGPSGCGQVDPVCARIVGVQIIEAGQRLRCST